MVLALRTGRSTCVHAASGKNCAYGTVAESLAKWLLRFAKTEVMALEDSGVSPIDRMTRSDLLAITDGRSGSKAIINTSLLPVKGRRFDSRRIQYVH